MTDTTSLLLDIISNNEDIYEIKQRLKQSLTEKGTYMQDVPFDKYSEKVDDLPVDDQKPPETQEKTLLPTPEGASIVADKNKYLSKVTVLGDGNLTSANILKGVSIFGVEGEIDTEKGLGDFTETLFLECMPTSSSTILSTIMTNGDIIMSSTSTTYPGLWFYSAVESEVTSIRDDSTWSIRHPVNGDYLVGSTASTGIGLYLYRKNYSDMIIAIEDGYNWNMFAITENDRLIYGTNSTTLGIYLYDSELRGVRQLHPDGYGWSVIQKVGEDYLISSNQSSCKGLLLYESDTKTIREICELGYNWGFFQMVGDKCLISGLNSTCTGILCFDTVNKSITQAYSSGYYWNNFAVLGEKTYISSTISIAGVLAYDHDSGEIEQVIPTLHSFTMHLFRDGKLLILSSTSTNSGLIVCDDEDGVRYEYTEGQNYKSIEMQNGAVLAGVNRIAFYDYDMKEMTTLYDVSGTWTTIHSDEGRCVFSGSATNSGMAIYDDSSKTLKQLCDFGNGWSYYFGANERCVFRYSGGFALCDLSEGVVLGTCLVSSTSYFNTIMELNEDYSILYNNTSSTSVGMVVCNLRDGKITLGHNQGSYWRQIVEIPIGWVISSNSSSSLGSFFLNSESGEMTQLASVGYNWTSTKSLGKHTLIGINSVGSGVYIYHDKLKTLTQLTALNNFSITREVEITDGIFIVSSTNSSYPSGFYLIGEEFLLVGATTGYNWNQHYEVGGGFLISTSSSSNQGVYFFDTDSTTVKQLYTSGYNWNMAQRIGDDCLLTSSYSSSLGVLLYDAAKKTITQKYTTGYNWNLFNPVGDNCIISSTVSSTTGMLFYSKSANTVSSIVSTGYGWEVKLLHGENCFVYSPVSTSYGMYYHDGTSLSRVATSDNVIYEDEINDNIKVLHVVGSYGFWVVNFQKDTIIRGNTSGNDWSVIDSFGDNAIIRSSSSDCIYMYDAEMNTLTLLSSSSDRDCVITQATADIYVVFGSGFAGFCVFNNATNRVARISTGSNWGIGVVLAVEGGCLISSEGSTYNGVYFYDATNNTIEQIYPDGYRWDNFIDVDCGYLMFSSIADNTGIPLYNKTSGEITLVIDYGVGWQRIGDVANGMVVTANDPEIAGVYLLNPQTFVLEQIVDIGYNWNLSTVVGDDILLASSTPTSTGIMLYNTKNGIISPIFDRGYDWGISFPVENGLLIISANASGILFYDASEKSIVVKFDEGYGWDNFRLIDDYFLIISSSSNVDCGVSWYEPTNGTIFRMLDSSKDLSVIDVSDNIHILYLKDQVDKFFILDSVSKSAIKSEVALYGSYCFQQVDDAYLIASLDSSGGGGVYVYNLAEKSLTRACAYGAWNTFQIVGNDCLIINSTNGSILLYDSSDKTITNKGSAGTDGGSILCMVGADCLIGGGYWIYLYDSSTKTATQKYSGYGMKYFQTIGTDCLIGTNGHGQGVWLYDSSTKTITQKCLSNHTHIKKQVI